MKTIDFYYHSWADGLILEDSLMLRVSNKFSQDLMKENFL